MGSTEQFLRSTCSYAQNQQACADARMNYCSYVPNRSHDGCKSISGPFCLIQFTKNPKARSFSMTASSHSLGSRGTGHFPQWHSGHSYYCLRALALLSYVCTRSSWWVKCPENQSPSCYDF